MGMHSAKKIAAAVTAVVQYLAEAEVAVAAPSTGPSPAPVSFAGPWGMAGRQESMALRDLWQRRIPKSW